MEDFITLSYGSGGDKGEELLKEVILPYIGNDMLEKLDDGAIFKLDGELCFSTDSFVVNPLFFKGGDIGKLSVCGTCNDILMTGGIPKYLSLSLIIEEGLQTEELKRVMKSISEAAKKANVKIITGDTKVVDKGHVDKLFINTAGIGIKDKNLTLGSDKICEDDDVIITGNIGDHGMTILCERNEFFESEVRSDCGCLLPLMNIVFEYKDKIKMLRDPTRGGVATVLNELVDNTNYSIELDNEKLPYSDAARGASELLGIDLLYSANEGKAVIVADKNISNELVKKLKEIDMGKDAQIIGKVVSYEKGKVFLKSPLGGRRIINKLSGDLFPRIC